MYHKSFLKWAGGKYSLLPTLLPLITDALPPGGHYIEPFLGGGVVTLNLPKDTPKLINDINPGVIAIWHALKTHGENFIKDVCNSYFVPRLNDKESYYKIRTSYNKDTSNAEKFLYLNRHCFNGLCRFNSNGEFNVPYGDYKKVYFPGTELRHALSLIENIQIHQNDFWVAMSVAQEGDVIYCDPPYLPLSSTSNFSTYSANGFNFKDHILLVSEALIARQRGATVIISNNDTPEARELYKHATEIKTIQVAKRISCKADGRKKQGELIAIFRPHPTFPKF